MKPNEVYQAQIKELLRQGHTKEEIFDIYSEVLMPYEVEEIIKNYE